jgi:hypothetical protein
MQLYLIDANNLLPFLSGVNPKDPEPELYLIELLQVFSRLRRTKVEVYLTSSVAGQAGPQTHAVIRAHYLAKGQTTAGMIRERLEKLGQQAHETLVVSADRRVQAECRAQRAPFLDAELFARELSAVPHAPPEEKPTPVKKPAPPQPVKPNTKDQPNLSSDELSEWMDMFRKK